MAPASFIDPCLPTKSVKPPSGDAWAHEIKHDGFRLQVHVRPDRVRLLTMTGIDWTARYPLIAVATSRIKGTAILDAEAVCPGPDGIADFEALHSRTSDDDVVAYCFDLLMHDGIDLRALPLIDRKARLDKLVQLEAASVGGLFHENTPPTIIATKAIASDGAREGDGEPEAGLNCGTCGGYRSCTNNQWRQTAITRKLVSRP